MAGITKGSNKAGCNVSNGDGDTHQQHIRNCDVSLKPFVGQLFQTIMLAIEFYRNYAREVGFDIRLGASKKDDHDDGIIWKYVYCNREGFKHVEDDVGTSLKKKNRRLSKRVGCKAKIAFKFCGANGYEVMIFVESHNHRLVDDQFKKYLKVNRNLDEVHQKFIIDCAKVNIGQTKSYRFYKEHVGGYSNVGCTKDDFKYFTQSMRTHIDGCDAQMMLNNMRLRKESCDAFFYDFNTDKDNKLKIVFWADPIARRNYSVFGDVVSFDCTYGTNSYKMIFSPFTGKDNHGKLVTFGAALMSGEDHESYIWVFEKFVECMGRHPGMIIIDQDPAMRIAVKKVFSDTRHRLCMWHIMMKVPQNAPIQLRNDESFMKRLNATVWSSMIKLNVFEEQWKSIMIDLELAAHSWFCSLYEIRQSWIPAYFRDQPMSRLCRTTSISESTNSFFNNYLNDGLNLVEFLMHFDRAIDAQRNSNDLRNNVDYSSTVKLETPLPVEKHAATIYTRTIFSKENGVAVIYEVGDGTGAPCSIPEKYIVSRWTKAAYLNPLSDVRDEVLDRAVQQDEKKQLLNQLISSFFACVGAVENDKESLIKFVGGIHDLRAVLITGEKGGTDSSNSRSKFFDMYFYSSRLDEVTVNNPIQVSTKGSGSRLVSRRAKAIERANKPKRMCKKCKEMGHHDSRNCPQKK